MPVHIDMTIQKLKVYGSMYRPLQKPLGLGFCLSFLLLQLGICIMGTSENPPVDDKLSSLVNSRLLCLCGRF